jgi:hypothetical protein
MKTVAMLPRKAGVVAVALSVLAGASAFAADVAAADAGAGEPAAAGAAGAGAESAVWTQKEVTFLYQGFTARYSCDGLRDKMHKVLLQLGARKQDLHVTEWGCAGNLGRPDPFPGVRVRMSVLQPAGGSAAPADAAPAQAAGGARGSASQAADPSQPVAAHWKSVDVVPDQLDRGTGSGDCELIDQIHLKILPLFATRKVDFQSNCIPYQATAGGSSLKVEVLQPDVKESASGKKKS